MYFSMVECCNYPATLPQYFVSIKVRPSKSSTSSNDSNLHHTSFIIRGTQHRSGREGSECQQSTTQVSTARFRKDPSQETIGKLNPRMWSAWHSDKVRCFVTQKTGDSTLEVKKALVEVEAWQPWVHVWWLLMYFCDILCCATIQQRPQRARSLCGNIQRLNVDWLLHVGTGRRSFIFYELFMHTD